MPLKHNGKGSHSSAPCPACRLMAETLARTLEVVAAADLDTADRMEVLIRALAAGTHLSARDKSELPELAAETATAYLDAVSSCTLLTKLQAAKAGITDMAARVGGIGVGTDEVRLPRLEDDDDFPFMGPMPKLPS